MEQQNSRAECSAGTDVTEAATSTGSVDGETLDGSGKTKKRTAKQFLAGYFTATRIAYLALFTALAYVLYLPWFEFYIFPAVSFMKIDFSNVFVMIAGFSLGPVAGVVVGVLKEILHALTFSQTVGVGELANILIMLPYVLIPSLIYKKRKGIKAVLLMMAGACAAQVVWSVPVNYLLTFPFYLNLYTHSEWAAGMQFYLGVWYWAVLFNLIKSLLVTVAVMILYKSISRLIKLTNAKFTKKSRSQ